MASVNLIGETISGKGDGRKYIQLPWVVQQIKKKIGFMNSLVTNGPKIMK